MSIQIRNKHSEVLLYEPIGEWLGGISATSFREAINGNDSTDIRINSPGGDVFDGLAMYQAMRDAPSITTYNDAQAASIASILLLAGDKIVSAAHSRVMIHNPYTLAVGDYRELRAIADQLETAKDSLLGIYTARTSVSADELSAMMDAETIFQAEKAVTLGFVDEVIEEAPRIAASAATWRTLSAREPEVVIKDGVRKLRVQGHAAAFREAADKFEEYTETTTELESGGVVAMGRPSWKAQARERKLRLAGMK